jgi:hypothetical protein
VSLSCPFAEFYNQIVSLTANTAANMHAPLYYDRVIVTNETTGDVYVSTDGSAVSTSEGSYGAIVLPGAWRMVGNDQPKQPLVSKKASGRTVQNTGWQGATEPNAFHRRRRGAQQLSHRVDGLVIDMPQDDHCSAAGRQLAECGQQSHPKGRVHGRRGAGIADVSDRQFAGAPEPAL